jgi:hypothetical protein
MLHAASSATSAGARQRARREGLQYRPLDERPHQVHRGQQFDLPQHARGLQLDDERHALGDERQGREKEEDQRAAADEETPLGRQTRALVPGATCRERRGAQGRAR